MLAICLIAFSCKKEVKYNCGTVVAKYTNNGSFLVVSAGGQTINASVSPAKYKTANYGDGVCIENGKVIE